MPASPKTQPIELRAILLRREAKSDPPLRVFGLDLEERLQRMASRLGASRCDILDAGEYPPLDPGKAHYLVLRAELVYDERLLAGLQETPNVVLADTLPGYPTAEALAAHVDGANLPAAVAALRGMAYQRLATRPPDDALDGSPYRFAKRLEVAPAYHPKLRKSLPPFVFLAEPDNLREIERALFKASYKGITDFVTKWLWPLPARFVTRRLAHHRVKPNTVTAVSYLLTALATWAFFEGWFVAGLVAGWAMTFLDTVDGKLARCTLTSSRLGDVLDHGLDLVHPPIWWAAWAWGVSAQFAGLELATAIVIGGYVTGRLLEGIFLLLFKQELFTWRRFDAFFRTIVARRNPNLVLLSVATAMGRPDLGFLALALWTLVANVVPLLRIAQALIERRRGVVIRSWYEEPLDRSRAETTA